MASEADTPKDAKTGLAKPKLARAMVQPIIGMKPARQLQRCKHRSTNVKLRNAGTNEPNRARASVLIVYVGRHGAHDCVLQSPAYF